MTLDKQGSLSIHPYIGGTTMNMVRTARNNGGIDPAFRGKFLLTLVATIALWPIRFMERILFARAIEKTQIAQAPIFIVGHWRSGTTHLHNIVSQDARLGFVSTLQAIFPTFCVLVSRSRTIKRLVARLIPERRMMDNVKMGLDFPQEEEFSLSCLTTSAHHCNHFPRTIRESFDKFVLFNVGDEEKERWKKTYLEVLRKATYLAGGKRLILKNPYNTARIKVLLEIFPDAKFIHIYRNPYNIYVSALHDFIKEAEEMALQEFSEDEFAELCFSLYEKLMKEYWETRALVPAGNLCEVAYEDLEEQPLAELRRIYEELQLGETEENLATFVRYLDTIRGYKKNRYSYSTSIVESIRERWGFAFEKFDYSLPRDIRVSDRNAWSCSMDY